MTRNAIATSLIAAAGLLTGTAQGQATVYEGFDYAETGNTNGLNGGTGFASGWESVNVWWRISSPGSSYGSLAVAGNKATSITRSGIARPLNSDLWNAGLLDNGSTLWFSAIVDITTGSDANSNLGFALTNSTGFRAPASDRKWHDLDFDGTTTDEGIGFAYNAFGQIGGAYWQDDDAGADAYSERVFSDDRISGLGTKLILGKIEWGADDAADEKLSLYEPDASLNIGTAVLADWTIPALDQVMFNRIALMGKDTPSIDEIRFGATSVDVMPDGGVLGVNYCGPAVPNSSGLPALISAHGSDDAADNDVRLDVSQLALNQFGMFVNSMSSGFVTPPGSQGNLCLSGGIGRHNANIMNSGATGAFSLQLDLTSVPTPAGPVAVQPGETWYWQAWFRDNNPTSTSNFTDGIAILFH